MLQRMLVIVLAAAVIPAMPAAKKERAWKLGMVRDSSTSQETYATGAVTSTNANGTVNATTTGGNTSGTVNARSTSTTSIQHVTVKINELLIAGDDYLYIIQDSRRQGGPILATALRNRKHGCRFIVGEQIKYAQEKSDLWVLDVDGKECKVPILRQEKR
jgi:hypothetical protein